MCDRNDFTNSLSKNFVSSNQTVMNTSRLLNETQFNSSSMSMSNQPRSIPRRSCDNGSNRINTLNNNYNNANANGINYGINNQFQSIRSDLNDDIDAPPCQISSNTTRSVVTTSLRPVQSMDNITNMQMPYFGNICSSSSANSSYDSIGDIDAPARSYDDFNHQFNRFNQFAVGFNNNNNFNKQSSFPISTFASEETSYHGFKRNNYQSEASIVPLNKDFNNFNLDVNIPAPKVLNAPKIANKDKDNVLPHAPQTTISSAKNQDEFRNIITKNVVEDIKEEDDIIMIDYVPSKLECNNKPIEELQRKHNDGCMIKPQYYNEYTSCVIFESPLYVLQTLAMLLIDIYSAYIPNKENISKDSKKDRNIREVDVIKTNQDDFTIKGIAYIKHKGVKFVLSIWHENENSGLNGNYESRVELQKHRGDSMIFHQFWSELLELMHQNFNKVSGAPRCPDFETFFIPRFDLSDIEMEDVDNNNSNNNNNKNQWKVEDFDEMAMDLNEDYREEGLDILATICDNINKDKLFINILTQHDELIKVLIKTLKHLDVCHIRGALCALDQMIEKMAEMNNINNNNEVDKIDYIVLSSSILGNLANLITHKSKLIKRRAEMLMGRLADVTKCEWNLGDKVRKQIDAWVIQFADNGNNNDNDYDYDGIDVIKMLNNIKNKLYY